MGHHQLRSRGFFSERPNEELYDIVVDPFETNNLADDREYEDTLIGMRVATGTGNITQFIMIQSMSSLAAQRVSSRFIVSQNPKVALLNSLIMAP